MKKSNASLFLGILITCMVFANFLIFSRIFTDSIPDAHYAPSDSNAPDTSTLPDSPENGADVPSASLPTDYKYITASTVDTHSGTLVLVNSTHPFTFDNVPTVVEKEVNDSIYYNKTASYFVRDINVYLNTVATAALNRMMDDFYAYQGNRKTVLINEGLRTREEQLAILEQKIAQLGENQTIAAKPGYSEHHTGYAMDLSLYENNVGATFTGEGDYAWFFENAHKYGFILRYPAGKEDITGISYESWHFRYVGVPHADYIYRAGIALEEYLDLLALYPYESEHLAMTDETTGDTYEVYSVAVSADGTQSPVPSVSDGTAYVLSGDNNGHVIVTVKHPAQ